MRNRTRGRSRLGDGLVFLEIFRALNIITRKSLRIFWEERGRQGTKGAPTTLDEPAPIAVLLAGAGATGSWADAEEVATGAGVSANSRSHRLWKELALLSATTLATLAAADLDSLGSAARAWASCFWISARGTEGSATGVPQPEVFNDAVWACNKAAFFAYTERGR